MRVVLFLVQHQVEKLELYAGTSLSVSPSIRKIGTLCGQFSVRFTISSKKLDLLNEVKGVTGEAGEGMDSCGVSSDANLIHC